MLEVGRLPGEAVAVAGVHLALAPPEVRRIGHEAVRGVNHRQRRFRRAEDVGRAARRRRVLQRVAGAALRRVHPDRQRVIGHTAAHQADRRLHRLRAGLACKLPVGGLHVGDGADALRHNRAGRLDGVGVALRADPHGAELLRVDARPRQSVARRLDRHRHHVFVQAGHSLFPHRGTARPARPDAGNLAAGQPVARHIRAIAGDAHRPLRPQQGGALLQRMLIRSHRLSAPFLHATTHPQPAAG